MTKPGYFRVEGTLLASNPEAAAWLYSYGFALRDWSKGMRKHDETTCYSPTFNNDQMPAVLRYWEAFSEAGLIDVTIKTEVTGVTEVVTKEKTTRWMPVDPSVVYEMIPKENDRG